MDVVIKIEEIKARLETNGGLLSSDKIFIETYYDRVLSKKFNRRACGQCYKDAFIEIYLFVKKNGIKEMGKYLLKREVVVHYNGYVYSRAGMTDEIAIAYLSKFPNAISYFEEYPEDWQEGLAEETEKRKTKRQKKQETDEK